MPEQKAPENDQEFELIPISPLRRLERRIDEVEKKSQHFDSKEFYKELVDIIRMNQQIVDEMAKSNDALRIELSKLPSRIEQTLARLDELVSFIKASGGEGGEAAVGVDMQPMLEKLTQIAETNSKILETNQALLSSMEDVQRKLKRPTLPAPPLRRPLILPTKPTI
jgi:regulator of replication initiation timing